MDKELPRYEPLEREAVALQVKAEAVDDRDVGRAASLLLRMIDHRHDVTSHLVKTVEEARLGQQRPLLDLHRIEDEESKRMTERWEQLAKVLSERYAFV